MTSTVALSRLSDQTDLKRREGTPEDGCCREAQRFQRVEPCRQVVITDTLGGGPTPEPNRHRASRFDIDRVIAIALRSVASLGRPHPVFGNRSHCPVIADRSISATCSRHSVGCVHVSTIASHLATVIAEWRT